MHIVRGRVVLMLLINVKIDRLYLTRRNTCEQAPTFLAHDQRQVAVVDEDAFAGLDDVDEVLVVEPQHVLGAGLLMLVVDGDRDRVSGLDFRLGVHALRDKPQQ